MKAHDIIEQNGDLSHPLDDLISDLYRCTGGRSVDLGEVLREMFALCGPRLWKPCALDGAVSALITQRLTEVVPGMPRPFLGMVDAIILRDDGRVETVHVQSVALWNSWEARPCACLVDALAAETPLPWSGDVLKAGVTWDNSLYVVYDFLYKVIRPFLYSTLEALSRNGVGISFRHDVTWQASTDVAPAQCTGSWKHVGNLVGIKLYENNACKAISVPSFKDFPEGWNPEEMYRLWVMEISSVCVEHLTSVRKNAFISLCAMLDSEAMDQAFSIFPLQAGAQYNWIVDGGPVLRDVRLQAFRAFPLLMSCLLNDANALPCNLVLSAIDRRENLVAALSSAWKLPSGAIRSFGGMSSLPGFKFSANAVTKILIGASDSADSLAGLWPRGSLQERTAGWRELCCVIKEWCMLSISGAPVKQTLTAALKEEPSTWLHPGFCGHRIVHGHINDMLDSFKKAVLMPMAMDDIIMLKEPVNLHSIVVSRHMLVVALGHGHNISSIKRLSRLWHDKQADAARSIALSSNEKGWPPLCAPRAAGCLLVVPLASLRDLAEEGAAMRHCILNYASDCKDGISHILSLRHEDGRRVSTLELSIQGGEVTVNQHCGWKNADPSPEAMEAADILLSDLTADTSLMDLAGIEAFGRERRAELASDPLAAIREKLGFDPMFDTARDVAFENHRFMLPVHMRHLARKEWVRAFRSEMADTPIA